jgi:hypothetical protein
VRRRAPGRKSATQQAPHPPAASVQPAGAGIQIIEERFAPIVAAVGSIARGGEPPALKLEGALEIIFGAHAQSDPDFSEMLLIGWMRARHDKHHRLALAWQREQLRLSLEEILQAGVAAGAFRSELDTGAVAAVLLGVAEGCLLLSATQGGAVPPAELVRALMRLTRSGA